MILRPWIKGALPVMHFIGQMSALVNLQRQILSLECVAIVAKFFCPLFIELLRSCIIIIWAKMIFL